MQTGRNRAPRIPRGFGVTISVQLLPALCPMPDTVASAELPTAGGRRRMAGGGGPPTVGGFLKPEIVVHLHMFLGGPKPHRWLKGLIVAESRATGEAQHPQGGTHRGHSHC